LSSLMVSAQVPTPESGKSANPDTSITDMGVAVTPSHVNFNLKPGASKTQIIKVTNDTRKTVKFQISFKDYDVDQNGKSVFMKPGEGKHSLSKWINFSPTFFELKPGEVQKISASLQVPDNEEGYKAAWGLLLINQISERQTLDDLQKSDKSVALGIIPTYSFGVYIYQNPPNVSINKVEIQNFKFATDTANKKLIEITAKNVGDGISQCASYVELTNINTGKQQKLLVKRFTVLPGYTRNFRFELPKDMAKGKYSAVGVLDFGSKDEIEAAELEFTIP